MYDQKTIDRFWAKVDKRGDDECWEWTASLKHGYGQFDTGLRGITAHKMSWILLYGDVPSGMRVSQSCRNRLCVNPRHLMLVDCSVVGRFWSKVNKRGPDDCWEWVASRNSQGYGQFSIGGRKFARAHRFSWELHNGPIAGGLFVCHQCDNPSCVNPSHLFLGTNNDNIQDAVKKGRIASGDRSGARTHPERMNHAHGEAHQNAKLTEKQVIMILRDNRLHREIAAEYGVSRGLVSMIKRGIAWTYIAREEVA